MRAASQMSWFKPTRRGDDEVQLTNFGAEIVEHVVRDDGAEERHELGIRVERGGVDVVVYEPMERLARVEEWAMRAHGPSAIVYPGVGRAHVVVAIQACSIAMKMRRVFAQTGWREHEGEWVYLHAGGAIGASGPRADVAVDLGDALAGFELPNPPAGNELRDAVRASLRLLDLGPAKIMVPLVGAVARAVLRNADFAIQLVGMTGVFKTELAALVQQHFGLK